ncbi:MAG: sulfite exporter TauE/SafE family protein [Pseudomonadota bacterium]
MGLEPGLLLVLFLIWFVAGTIKGTVGIGMPTAAVGMMSQVIDPRAAIAMVVVPSMLTNAWQVWRSGDVLGAIRRYKRFLVCLVAMILLVSLLVTAHVPTDTLIFVLGCVVVTFSVMSLGWAPPIIPQRHDRIGQVLAGGVAGGLGGLTAIWAPPMIVYLTGRRVEKDEFVRASGLIIFTGTLPLLFTFSANGMMDREDMVLGAAMTLPALLGFQVGERIRGFLDTDRFRTAVLILFLLLGLNLIRRAFL